MSEKRKYERVFRVKINDSTQPIARTEGGEEPAMCPEYELRLGKREIQADYTIHVSFDCLNDCLMQFFPQSNLYFHSVQPAWRYTDSGPAEPKIIYSKQ